MYGFLASLIAAFTGGALSFLSPCVLPLVPGYLCFAAGLQFSDLAELESKGEARRAILPGALAFVAGFSSVFIALGAGAAAINPFLLAYQDILAQVAGGFIILLGLHMTHIIQLPLLGREARLLSSGPQKTGKSAAPLLAAFAMGLAFAFGWTPCIGPILATILALAAARDSLGEGVTLLSVYALGLGIPFILAALGVGRFLAASQRIKQHMVWVERGAGGLLMLTGALIMLGTLQAVASYLLDWFPALSTLG
jgi:cytochrome c-type biogenesis protein